MKLVASLICKNEAARYLPACIDSLLAFVDEVRVLDDGSTDGSYEYLRARAGVEVIRTAESMFFQHEGRARQRLLDFTLEGDPGYVLAVDCDEFVADGAAVRAFCEQGHDLGTLVMEEVWEADAGELRVRCDGGWRPHPVPILWRVPKALDESWRIQDRALACGREPKAVRNLARYARSVTEILHFGWADEAERAARYQRYVEADGGKFHNRRHLDSIMWTGRQVRLTSRRWPRGLSLQGGRVEYGP